MKYASQLLKSAQLYVIAVVAEQDAATLPDGAEVLAPVALGGAVILSALVALPAASTREAPAEQGRGFFLSHFAWLRLRHG